MEELKIVTMDELKAQLRVDFEDEDEIISLYGAAAEDYVINETRRTIAELNLVGYIEKFGESAIEDVDPDAISLDKQYFPKRLKLAMLMLAAHLYRNREPVAAVNQNTVPYTLEALVKPYRRLTKKILSYVDYWKSEGEGGNPSAYDYERFSVRRTEN